MDFFGFEIFHSGIFGVGKFGKYFFGGTQNNVKRRGSARVSRPRSSANKVQPNLFLRLFYCCPRISPRMGNPKKGTLVARSYIKKSTYTVEIYSQYTKKKSRFA